MRALVYYNERGDIELVAYGEETAPSDELCMWVDIEDGAVLDHIDLSDSSVPRAVFADISKPEVMIMDKSMAQAAVVISSSGSDNEISTLQEITLSMHGLMSIHHIDVQQNDTSSRKVRIRLTTFEGKPYAVPSDSTAVLFVKKADGHKVYEPCEIEPGGSLLVTIKGQTTTCPGEQTAQIYIVSADGDKDIKSQTFTVRVAPSPYTDDAIESTDEYGVLAELIQRISDSAGVAEEAVIKADNAATMADEAVQMANEAMGIAETIKAAPEQIIANTKNLRTKSGAIVQTASGENIVAKDSSDDPVRGLRVFGKSTQVTTTGAQLYDVSEVGQNANATVDADGWITVDCDNTNGDTIRYLDIRVYQSGLIQVKKNYMIVCEVKNIGDMMLHAVSSYTANIKGQFKSDLTVNQIGTYCEEITARDDFTGCVSMLRTICSIDAGKHGKAIFRISVIEDISVTADTFVYEPFTGGKPSPSPDYPQEIVSVGDSVETKIYGTNLLDTSQFTLNSNTSLDILDNGYTIVAKGKAAYARSVLVLPANLINGKTIHFEYDSKEQDNNSAGVSLELIRKDDTHIFFAITEHECFTFEKEEYKTGLLRIISNNTATTLENDASITVKGLRITLAKDTPWEPYTAHQTLTVSTPNGLPGIPVSDVSLANYTDSNGQMWCCDEVDLERGVYVQRVAKSDLEFGHALNTLENTHELRATTPDDACATNKNYFLCDMGARIQNLMPNKDNTWDIDKEYAMSYAGKTSVGFPDVSLRVPVGVESVVAKFVYILAAPIETPLSEEALAAYQSLHSNYPVTTVLNDANAWMEIAYNVDPKNYIAAEHAKMEAAFDAKLAEIIALLPAETQAAMIENETTNLLNESEV